MKIVSCYPKSSGGPGSSPLSHAMQVIVPTMTSIVQMERKQEPTSKRDIFCCCLPPSFKQSMHFFRSSSGHPGASLAIHHPDWRESKSFLFLFRFLVYKRVAIIAREEPSFRCRGGRRYHDRRLSCSRKSPSLVVACRRKIRLMYAKRFVKIIVSMMQDQRSQNKIRLNRERYCRSGYQLSVQNARSSTPKIQMGPQCRFHLAQLARMTSLLRNLFDRQSKSSRSNLASLRVFRYGSERK